MTEKGSHDVNVMLFICVSQLSKLSREGGGSYLNQKMFYTVQMLRRVLFIQILLFEMQQFNDNNLTLRWRVALFPVESQSCFLRVECKRWFLLRQCKLDRPHRVCFPNQFYVLNTVCTKKNSLCCSVHGFVKQQPASTLIFS